jgi:hypothetical protein
MQLSFCREETKAMADQIQCSTHGELQAGGLAAQAQAVAGPLTRAAIFLVATLKPSFENRGTIRSFCGDLAALLRAVEFRDLEGGLSCVMGFGSDAWIASLGGHGPKSCIRSGRFAPERAMPFPLPATCCSTCEHVRRLMCLLCAEVRPIVVYDTLEAIP